MGLFERVLEAHDCPGASSVRTVKDFQAMAQGDGNGERLTCDELLSGISDRIAEGAFKPGLHYELPAGTELKFKQRCRTPDGNPVLHKRHLALVLLSAGRHLLVSLLPRADIAVYFNTLFALDTELRAHVCKLEDYTRSLAYAQSRRLADARAQRAELERLTQCTPAQANALIANTDKGFYKVCHPALRTGAKPEWGKSATKMVKCVKGITKKRVVVCRELNQHAMNTDRFRKSLFLAILRAKEDEMEALNGTGEKYEFAQRENKRLHDKWTRDDTFVVHPDPERNAKAYVN
jgi:hypothetical protein